MQLLGTDSNGCCCSAGPVGLGLRINEYSYASQQSVQRYMECDLLLASPGPQSLSQCAGTEVCSFEIVSMPRSLVRLHPAPGHGPVTARSRPGHGLVTERSRRGRSAYTLNPIPSEREGGYRRVPIRAWQWLKRVLKLDRRLLLAPLWLAMAWTFPPFDRQ